MLLFHVIISVFQVHPVLCFAGFFLALIMVVRHFVNVVGCKALETDVFTVQL